MKKNESRSYAWSRSIYRILASLGHPLRSHIRLIRNSFSSLIAPRNNTKTSGLAKCNPLAYWTLEDCFDYISKYKVPHHPCHAQGYPSHGDAKDTIPIPR